MKVLKIATSVAVPLTLLAGLAACGSGDQQADSASTAVKTDAPLYAELPKSIRDKGEIVFVGDSHPPYRTVEADGSTVTGLDPELQAALSKELGVPIRMKISQGLPQMLAGMQAGRYDAFDGPVKATKERLKEFDGVSWLTSRTSYLIPAKGGIDAKDAAGLCGTTTAGVKGSITEGEASKLSDWCSKHGKDAVTFLGLADTNATLLAVKSGRAQSAATTQAGAIDVQTQQKTQWRYVSQTGEQGAGRDQLVLLTPKTTKLGKVFESAFQRIFDNGEYDKLVKKYHLEDVKIDAPKLNPDVD